MIATEKPCNKVFIPANPSFIAIAALVLALQILTNYDLQCVQSAGSVHE